MNREGQAWMLKRGAVVLILESLPNDYHKALVLWLPVVVNYDASLEPLFWELNEHDEFENFSDPSRRLE